MIAAKVLWPLDKIQGFLLRGYRESNAELVKKIVDNCAKFDRRPATTAEARQILGLRAA